MKMLSFLIALLLTTVIIFACGSEKKEESPMTEQPPLQVQQGTPTGESVWETLPPFPGTISTRARMAPGNRGYAKFEIRVFQSQETARKIVDFYKQEMPQEWAFAEETELDNGLQGQWEAKTNQATLWVRVTQIGDGEGNEIEIIYGRKK